MKVSANAPLGKFEWTFVAALLGGCVLCFLTQPINTYPHDGWYETQDRLWQRQPGGVNFTPVAAPALLYGGLHAAASLLGLGLESELILGSLVQQLMLAFCGVAIFMAHRRLGLIWSGAIASLLAVLFVESVFLPESLWSENVMLLMASLALWWSVEIGSGAANGRRLEFLTVGLGLLIGLGTITRATPIVLLPSVIWLAWPGVQKGRRRRFAAVLLTITATIITAQMALNHWRYGRFELSHSVGLRLWDGISFASDRILDDSPLYEQMKRSKPDIQGAWWWDLPRPPGVGPTLAHMEDAVRPMVVEGIKRHPLLFLREGIQGFLWGLPRAPRPIGTIRATYVDPLIQSGFLTPPGWAAPGLTVALNRYWLAVKWVFYPLVLLVGFGGGLLGTLIRRLRPDSTADSDSYAARVWLWVSFALLSIVYLSNQIEKPDSRFALPYVGFVALLGSIGISQAITAGHRLKRGWSKTAEVARRPQ